MIRQHIKKRCVKACYSSAGPLGKIPNQKKFNIEKWREIPIYGAGHRNFLRPLLERLKRLTFVSGSLIK
jgi:hypothetical protein